MPLNFIFDFAGTIADLSPSSADMLRSFLKEYYNIHIDKRQAERAYDCVDRSLFYSSVKIHDMENKKSFYKYYNDLILKNLALFDIVDNSKNQLFEYFISIKRHWTLKYDVKDTFEILKEEEKTISIISNFDSKLNEIIENLGISKFIDNIHISQDVGYEKPDIRFYQLFFDKYPISIEESVYIGDSYELDFLPATSLGIETFLIDERERFAKRNNIITSISQILQKL